MRTHITVLVFLKLYQSIKVQIFHGSKISRVLVKSFAISEILVLNSISKVYIIFSFQFHHLMSCHLPWHILPLHHSLHLLLAQVIVRAHSFFLFSEKWQVLGISFAKKKSIATSISSNEMGSMWSNIILEDSCSR